MATLIERDIVSADYGLPCETMIVDLKDGRRVFLSQGFGGMSSLEGGCCRWKHGGAVLLLPADTMATVQQMQEFDGYTSDWDCLLYNGKDSSGRKLLDWPGEVIDSVARSAYQS